MAEFLEPDTGPDRPDDRPAEQLDDEFDREELRARYYGLLQELRVLLPGVQILVAFLLTVPFATGFDTLDATGRDLYGLSLTSGVLAIVAFTAPTFFHRLGRRQSRAKRLYWGIRLVRVGLALLGVTLLAAFTVVTRVAFSPVVAGGLVFVVALGMAVMWIALPVTTRQQHRPTTPRR